MNPCFLNRDKNIFFHYFSRVKMQGSEFRTPGFRMKGEMYKQCGFVRKKFRCPQKMKKVNVTRTVLFSRPPVLTTCNGKKLYKNCSPQKYEQCIPTFILLIPPETRSNAHFLNIQTVLRFFLLNLLFLAE